MQRKVKLGDVEAETHQEAGEGGTEVRAMTEGKKERDTRTKRRESCNAGKGEAGRYRCRDRSRNRKRRYIRKINDTGKKEERKTRRRERCTERRDNAGKGKDERCRIGRHKNKSNDIGKKKEERETTTRRDRCGKRRGNASQGETGRCRGRNRPRSRKRGYRNTSNDTGKKKETNNDKNR